MEFITKNIKWLAPLAVAALAAIWVISSFVGIRNTGVEKEAGLNAQYKVNQNSLSTCLVKIADSANLTKAESEQLRGALEDAVKGRYDGRTANPGQMFSAIVENYPDLKVFDEAFKRAYATIIGCRSDYQGDQNKLTDMIRDFDSWRQKWPTAWFTDTPSARLEAGDRHGADALVQMKRLVLTSGTQQAYESGELPTSNPWAPTPAPSSS